jgi:hypothetical protein
MDLPLFNLTIKANDNNNNWRQLFFAKFESLYENVTIPQNEYTQLQRFLIDWVEMCVFNTKTYENARDDKDHYDEYQIRMKFPKYVLVANVTIYRE